MITLEAIGDIIAKETKTNFCKHHRIEIARAVVKWLSEQEPSQEMVAAAAESWVVAMKREFNADPFTQEFKGAMAKLGESDQ